MPRPRLISDAVLLDTGLDLMRRQGVEGLTLSALAAECGLSPSTLVQRFGSKAGLTRAALHRGWTLVEEASAEVAAAEPQSPAGAIRLLARLSDGAPASATWLLRTGFEDADLRRRGAAWGERLAADIDGRLSGLAPAGSGLGRMMLAQWQGVVAWWTLDRAVPLPQVVEDGLGRWLALIDGRGGA